ncbi:aminotransferase class I/II-fold pyridoxal phosphate-dependent enzyme [Candidatus Woesearchaeota archaeon]|nr:aminotransferase class I/II-fold pyridoxal phosphate-dependent enzyme [Candidatus Woesearchaeota archaeon]
MPLSNLNRVLMESIKLLEEEGRLKGKERVITKVEKPKQGSGFRYFLEGHPDRGFIKMDSNSYLGLNLDPELAKAEHSSSLKFGVGPGAVRFIDGTFLPHVQLEKALAEFHSKEACMIFSSAYAAVCGVLAPLLTEKSIVLSDELNHNCIINAIRLAKVPKERKFIYRHLDYSHLREGLDYCLKQAKLGECERVIIVTDGVFSMRGDYADLRRIQALAEEYNDGFKHGVITMVDDSHGVGAYGATGRGTTEVTKGDVDILVATLGKALGVNGGYVTSSKSVVAYLRETSPFYVYSNPITPGEASAALKALNLLSSDKGKELLERLASNTKLFKQGVKAIGYEIIEGEHPIVPLLVRDTKKTKLLVRALFEKGILVVGLTYPVVPKGEETIRFQVSAAHTKADLEYVLNVLKELRYIIE